MHTASACQINGVRSLYAMLMRSLEVHYFETERDLSLALTSGLILPEQLVITGCSECKEKLAYSGTQAEFTPFVLVVDENDQVGGLRSLIAFDSALRCFEYFGSTAIIATGIAR